MRRKLIGEFLVQKGLLTQEEAARVLDYAAKARLKFSQAALELGILRNDRPLKRSRFEFFHLDAKYFPPATRTLFPTALLLKHGVLPLGYKTTYRLFQRRKILNLGFLDPEKSSSVSAIEGEVKKTLGKEIAGTQNYLVLAEEFTEVLSKVYHVDEKALRSCPAEDLDPVLNTFLHTATDIT